MLVLTRRLNEAILIGDVRVVVVRLGPACVALGIEAPAEVPVDREEVRLSKRLHNPTGDTGDGVRDS